MQGLLGMCHHTSNKSSNVADCKTTYLVGRSRFFSKFEYVYFSSLKIAPGMIDCRSLLEHPSCFVGNLNFLTQFNISKKIEPYTDLLRQLIECWIVFIIHSHKRWSCNFLATKVDINDVKGNHDTVSIFHQAQSTLGWIGSAPHTIYL